MSDMTERPLVTFAVIAYNQERFIREAIEGAFAQTYQPLEIILSDDCSPDRTYAIMQEMAAAYTGPHKVVLNRNEPNLRLADHFNTIVQMMTGRYLVVAAGDDISQPDRCEIVTAPLRADTTLSCVSTAKLDIDETGHVCAQKGPAVPEQRVSLTDVVRHGNRTLLGASRCYRRSSLMAFPPLDRGCPTEDSTCRLRCLMTGDEQILPTCTVRRRMHAGNLSGADSLRKMNLDAIHDQYLADARHAFAEGHISAQDHKATVRWAKRQIALRKLNQRMSGDDAPGLWSGLICLARAKDIDPRIKLSGARMLLRKVLY